MKLINKITATIITEIVQQKKDVFLEDSQLAGVMMKAMQDKKLTQKDRDYVESVRLRSC